MYVLKYRQHIHTCAGHACQRHLFLSTRGRKNFGTEPWNHERRRRVYTWNNGGWLMWSSVCVCDEVRVSSLRRWCLAMHDMRHNNVLTLRELLLNRQVICQRDVRAWRTQSLCTNVNRHNPRPVLLVASAAVAVIISSASCRWNNYCNSIRRCW